MKNIYVKTTWVDNKTPINAANLNKIENAVSNLYQNALSASDFKEGKGIHLEVKQDKKLEISVSEDVVSSCTVCGIEVVTSYSHDIAETGVMYYVIDPETRKLTKIVFNSVTIYEME